MRQTIAPQSLTMPEKKEKKQEGSVGLRTSKALHLEFKAYVSDMTSGDGPIIRVNHAATAAILMFMAIAEGTVKT